MKAQRQTRFRLITRRIQYRSPHIDINPNKPVLAVKAIFVEKYSRLWQSVQNKQVSTSTSLRNFTPADDYVFCKEVLRTLGAILKVFIVTSQLMQYLLLWYFPRRSITFNDAIRKNFLIYCKLAENGKDFILDLMPDGWSLKLKIILGLVRTHATVHSKYFAWFGDQRAIPSAEMLLFSYLWKMIYR